MVAVARERRGSPGVSLAGWVGVVGLRFFFPPLASSRRRDCRKANPIMDIRQCRCRPVQDLFEMVETKLFLELLMRLLADPAPPYGPGKLLQRGARGKVG